MKGKECGPLWRWIARNRDKEGDRNVSVGAQARGRDNPAREAEGYVPASSPPSLLAPPMKKCAGNVQELTLNFPLGGLDLKCQLENHVDRS